jgi:hypothetical protein
MTYTVYAKENNERKWVVVKTKTSCKYVAEVVAATHRAQGYISKIIEGDV